MQQHNLAFMERADKAGPPSVEVQVYTAFIAFLAKNSPVFSCAFQ